VVLSVTSLYLTVVASEPGATVSRVLAPGAIEPWSQVGVPAPPFEPLVTAHPAPDAPPAQAHHPVRSKTRLWTDSPTRSGEGK
jgi:hypothetical protein